MAGALAAILNHEDEAKYLGMVAPESQRLCEVAIYEREIHLLLSYVIFFSVIRCCVLNEAPSQLPSQA